VDSPEQIDSWNRTWVFFEWTLRPYEDRSKITAVRENWPKDVIAGRDPQLERAVDEALRLLKAKSVDRSTREPPSPTWGKRK
jgi:hypothetical protein